MKYTDEELVTLNPELAKILEKRPQSKLPVPTKKTLPIFRKGFSAVAQRFTNSPFAKAVLGPAFSNPTWTEIDHSVPVRDGSDIKVRTYVPNDLPQDGLPVAVFLHGGGWVMGDLDTEALTCRIWASQLNLIAVNVAYRLYPEVPFGIPVTDTIDAFRWISANAGSFGGNLRKGFIVGGSSGGTTYASIAAHHLRNEGLEFPITGCFYSCPIFPDQIGEDVKGEPVYMFDPETESKSHTQNANAPLMTREMQEGIQKFADFDFRSSLLGPFHNPPFENLPRTFIQVCGLDPWRDCGILYEKTIREANNETKITIFPGLPHCFWTSFPQLQATEAYLNDMLCGMKWLLSTDSAKL